MKQRKLTLKETWTVCLAMWKWISEEYVKPDTYDDAYDLKRQWLKDNGYDGWDLAHYCFFCEYGEEQGEILINAKDRCGRVQRTCPTCPGRQVSKRFQCENYDSYHWRKSPVKFYKKLVELHKRFLANSTI